jgi:hypothetical protein
MAHVTSGEALEDKVLDSKQQNQHEGADDQKRFHPARCAGGRFPALL